MHRNSLRRFAYFLLGLMQIIPAAKRVKLS